MISRQRFRAFMEKIKCLNRIRLRCASSSSQESAPIALPMVFRPPLLEDFSFTGHPSKDGSVEKDLVVMQSMHL
ncbi:unnamed protein product [Camellia sinensis]